MRSLSLPHEHGAYLTLVGGGVAAALQAPRPLAAVGFGVVLAAAFFAREPLVKRARWDDAFLVLLAVAAAVGAAMAEWPWGSVAAAGAAAIVGGFLAARRARQHRAPWFEWVGMAALGGAAGLEAAAGGAAWPRATALGLLLAAHVGVAVPLVRTQLRRRERAQAARADAVAFGVLGASAAAVAVAGFPAIAIAFLPRTAHLTWRRLAGVRPARPAVVGVREVVLLSCAVALAMTT
ncbi:MAG TPA: hypothetical protein VKE22_13235 [Haliangiales bacterium]|nr:hypothetical protein [Haliangiales bacterium]